MMKDFLEAGLAAFVVFLFFYVGIILDGRNMRKNFLKYKEQGLRFIKEYNSVKYYGGIKGFDIEHTGKVIIFSDRVRILNNTIYLEDVESCKVQTERQITEGVSMGKLLFFGVLAFGMKGKQKELSKKYIVLRYKCLDEMRDVIMDFDSKNEDFERWISIIKRELRENENKIQDNILN